MGEEGATKVRDVDEMFESFVKKKLQQLGMKRASTKSSTDEGTMNDLELSIKTRLEKNIAQNLVKDGNDEDDGLPKAKKRKKEKKHKKKNKKKDMWLEKDHRSHDKERKSKKEKLRNKKESSKRKKKANNSESEKSSEISDKPRNVDEMETTSKITETTKFQFHDETDKKLAESENIPTGNQVSQAEHTSLASTSQEIHLKKTVTIKTEQDVTENSASMTAGSKKDIATIKMKIELLKAKSEGEKVQQQVDVLLKRSAQGQNSEHAGVEESPSSERTSESKELKQTSSRSRSRSKSRKHSKSHSRHHARSPSRDRRHTTSRHHRSRSPSKRSRHRSRSRDRHRSKRSRRHSRSPLISRQDKVRLLEIAKANALAQHRAGVTAISVSSAGQIVKEGTMSVRELTNMCTDISTGIDDGVIPLEPLTKESAEKMLKEAETNKVHHPFAVKDTAITFNIKQIRSVAIKLPPPAATQPLTVLSKEFPVSCGQQHRRKEVLENVYGKWQVVAKDEATKKAVKEIVSRDKVFAEPEQTDLKLSNVIADRISAVRQLQDNPNSKEAQEKMDTAQKALNDWTKSQQVPGQFTGHSGLTAMPRSVLEGGKQAWFKADNLKNAKHVTGIGKSLLQKMGWTPGMPLGKTMPGQLEPLSVTFKTDRRGLSSYMEVPVAPAAKKASQVQARPTVKDLSAKHPVSALMEICSKRHWPLPDFRLLDPLNMKIFTYRVLVSNDEYIGASAGNKKQAKLLAATAALQNMGLVPKI